MSHPSVERPASSLTTETQHAHVAQQSIHLSIDRLPDGRPVRVWVELHKEGSTLRGWAEALAAVMSAGLAHGVPVEALVEALEGIHCDPAGAVEGHEAITSATSIPDYIGRALAYAAGRRP